MSTCLNKCLIHPLKASLVETIGKVEPKVLEFVNWLETSLILHASKSHFKPLDKTIYVSAASKPFIEESPSLELKPLPSYLKYANLGEDSTLPVIISTSFSNEQEKKLLVVLRKHKKSLC